MKLPLTYKQRIGGIYAIVNRVNGKTYVGSAARCFYDRAANHRSDLRRNCHPNSYLQRAWNKYGEAAFEFKILERCSAKKCVQREQYWIDVTDRSKGYNINITASSRLGMKHSLKTRKQMSLKRKGIIPVAATLAAAKSCRGKKRPKELCEYLSKCFKGKKKSKAHRASIKANHWRNRPDWKEIAGRSAAKLRGRKHSEEHKQKISEAGFRRWYNVRHGIEV